MPVLPGGQTSSALLGFSPYPYVAVPSLCANVDAEWPVSNLLALDDFRRGVRGAGGPLVVVITTAALNDGQGVPISGITIEHANCESLVLEWAPPGGSIVWQPVLAASADGTVDVSGIGDQDDRRKAPLILVPSQLEEDGVTDKRITNLLYLRATFGPLDAGEAAHALGCLGLWADVQACLMPPATPYPTQYYNQATVLKRDGGGADVGSSSPIQVTKTLRAGMYRADLAARAQWRKVSKLPFGEVFLYVENIGDGLAWWHVQRQQTVSETLEGTGATFEGVVLQQTA